jgi:hypothetical protein
MSDSSQLNSCTGCRRIDADEVLNVKSENRLALTAAVAARVRDIPDVRIYEDSIVTVRTK